MIYSEEFIKNFSIYKKSHPDKFLHKISLEDQYETYKKLLHRDLMKYDRGTELFKQLDGQTTGDCYYCKKPIGKTRIGEPHPYCGKLRVF